MVILVGRTFWDGMPSSLQGLQSHIFNPTNRTGILNSYRKKLFFVIIWIFFTDKKNFLFSCMLQLSFFVFFQKLTLWNCLLVSLCLHLSYLFFWLTQISTRQFWLSNDDRLCLPHSSLPKKHLPWCKEANPLN